MQEFDTKKILVISDFLSSGNIGGNLVRDVLSFYDFEVEFIPSTLISNKFSISPIEISRQNEYLENTLKYFKEQKKSYDAIFIGLTQVDQTSFIKDFVKDYTCPIILDPIMGDKGKLYKSLDKSIIKSYKNIMKVSDIILPNFTESTFLTDHKFSRVDEILVYFSNLGKKTIITSVKEDDRFFIYAFEDNLIKIEFEHIAHNFAGCGDLFDSFFIINYLNDFNFYESIINTKNKVHEVLKIQSKLNPKKSDIDIIKILKIIDDRK